MTRKMASGATRRDSDMRGRPRGGRRVAVALGLAVSVATLLAGCAGTSPSESSSGFVQRGEAAYYSDAYQGELTANGERYDRSEMTAAHRSLPFGTQVEVTNLDNGRQVSVRINDRGPFTPGRIIDLSYRAAKRLGMIRSGIAPVRLEVVN